MILLIDTTTNPSCIGIWNGKKLKTRELEFGPDNNKRIVSEIKKLTKLNQVEAVGIISGPGTFTGVRTGVTIANTMAYALKIPLYATDTLSAQVPNKINHVVSLLSASNTELYFARFEKRKMQGKIEILEIGNLKNRLNNEDIIVGDLSTEHCKITGKQAFNKKGATDRVRTLLDLIISKNLKPQKMILPLYIKKPNITTSKKRIY